jgi:hypothetical protein
VFVHEGPVEARFRQRRRRPQRLVDGVERLQHRHEPSLADAQLEVRDREIVEQRRVRGREGARALERGGHAGDAGRCVARDPQVDQRPRVQRRGRGVGRRPAHRAREVRVPVERPGPGLQPARTRRG